MLTLFIADDSPHVRAGLTSLLGETAGIRIVGEAADVPGAIHGIRELRPDVVVLDFSMPSGNGLEVLAAVKQSVPPPVVIMLTIFSYTSLRERCRQAGADYFFDKFTELEALLRLMRELAVGEPAHAPGAGGSQTGGPAS